MKFTSLFIGLVFLLNANYSSAYRIDERRIIRNNFPHLEEVLTHLNTKLKFECKDCSYGVAKKRSGYFLTMYNYTTKKTAEVPVWKAEMLNYVEFSIDDYVDVKKVRTSNSADLNNIYNFRTKYDFMLVYGYDSWAKDAIDLLSKYSAFSNEDREILARAHGELASEIIQNRNNGLNQHLRSYAKIDQTQVDLFMEEINVVMQYWKDIKKNDEKYPPLIIKDLNLKIGNEYMHYYNMLLSLKEEKLAEGLLKQSWYSASQVQSAKNLLYGCPEKSFLFTQGDSDTFPVWYVQNKLDYRRDVIVLNTSLLYTPWYLQMNKDRYHFASTLNQNNYRKILDKGQYVDKSSSIEPFKQWLTKKLTTEDTLEYGLIPKSFMIPYQGANVEFKMVGEIGQNTLAMLDIISSNSDRQVNFVSPYQMYSLGLEFHYHNRGKSFLLTNVAPETNCDQETIKMLDNLLYYMDYKYLFSLSHTASSELRFVSFGIDGLRENFERDRERMIQKFMKQVPTSSLIKFENYEFLETVNSLYADIYPIQSEQLKKELEPIVLERIKEITSLNKDLDKDIRDLENIFGIYAGVHMQWSKYEDVLVKPNDRTVLMAVKDKIKSLEGNAVIAQREWTRLKLVSMRETLDKLDLSQQ
ncbi:MAG: hypothetical protein HRT57_12310 [Crocinitomicaceae bacterium]|nr:hypothetical protein [Crocinitomicaceae bacterium]